MADLSTLNAPDVAAGAVLGVASRDAFAVAAAAVERGGAVDLVDVGGARLRDEHAAVKWTAAELAESGELAFDLLIRHQSARVLSISADVMQNLAARSCGVKLSGAELGLDVLTSTSQHLRDNLSRNSIWFRNAVRTGIAVAGAVLVARLLGLEHGFWVAVTALTLVQVTFTAGASSRSAIRTSFGVVAGVALSGMAMWLLPQAWMFVALLPLSAFFAKWAASRGHCLGNSHSPCSQW